MAWSETIKIQTWGQKDDEQCVDFLSTVQKKVAATREPVFRLFVHKNLPNQYMIWLEWNSRGLERGHSNLSKELIHELKHFGLVDYSAWVISDEK